MKLLFYCRQLCLFLVIQQTAAELSVLHCYLANTELGGLATVIPLTLVFVLFALYVPLASAVIALPLFIRCGWLCFVQYKLCKVKKVLVGLKGVPSIVTSDGRTIRYPDPLIKVNDTVRVNIATGKIEEFVKFDSGNCLVLTYFSVRFVQAVFVGSQNYSTPP